ncbi:DNA-binding response regulator [Salinimicrobium marinum]|uniref:DNA-binding response regulator n=1 Tax=Salinimicrobium marinum TaxID=680283 RepID=A0A918S8R9_9FLAO|nr:response regulator transcription factor [Salinimicrobium marinum]GHA29622.1 DNA-binding response regulator [Salinimicrobium marinum]
MSEKILVVDDHILFSQSLKGLINSLQDFEVLDVLKNGQELVTYYESNKIKPDIVLLDIRMPVMDGIETMEWFKENFPDQKVLALTMEHEEETIIKMLKLGCRGYLLKDIDPDEFRYAMETVLQSGYYYSNEVAEVILHSEDKRKDQFTKRELEFLHLVCSERTYKEIAGEMNLSPKTIDGYREQLFAKLNAKSRTGVVLYAIKNKVVSI